MGCQFVTSPSGRRAFVIGEAGDDEIQNHRRAAFTIVVVDGVRGWLATRCINLHGAITRLTQALKRCHRDTRVGADGDIVKRVYEQAELDQQVPSFTER